MVAALRMRASRFALTSPALAQSPEPEARSFRAYIESLRPLAQQRGVTPRDLRPRAHQRPLRHRSLAAVAQAAGIRPPGRRLSQFAGGAAAHQATASSASANCAACSIRSSTDSACRAKSRRDLGHRDQLRRQPGRQARDPLARNARLPQLQGRLRARRTDHRARSSCRSGHIPPERMIGSWAGAMGQPQFIASSFMRWAVDFSGDGKRDLWTSCPTCWPRSRITCASMAGSPACPGAIRCRCPTASIIARAAARFREWVTLGFRRADGGNLPTTTMRDEAIAVVSVRRARTCLSGHEEFRGDQDLQYLGCLRARGAPPRRPLSRRAAVRRPLAGQRRAALARGPDDDSAGAGEARASSRTTCRA